MSKQFKSEALQDFAGRQILITGGAGYLATSVIGLLRGVDCRIIRLDRREARLEPVEGKAQIKDVHGDVRDREMWGRILDGVDVVFHFAAQTSTYVANENPRADLDSNVVPMMHLLETCRQRGWKPTVLFASTVTIVGVPTRLPVDETYPANPLTFYDMHKLISEQYLQCYIRQGIVKGAILRLANVYGPGPRSSRSDRGILNQMIRKALAAEPLTVYRPGAQLRDYVYVEDVAWAFLYASWRVEVLNGQFYVISSGHGHSIAEAINLVADRVSAKTGKHVKVNYIDPPPNQSAIEERNFIGSSLLFSQATGWHAEYQLSDGIDRTLETLL